MNKIKLMQHDSAKPTQTKGSTQRDPKQNENADAVIKQLKARIQNLEKSYDLSKQKIQQLESDGQKRDLDLKKRDEDVIRLKQ